MADETRVRDADFSECKHLRPLLHVKERGRSDLYPLYIMNKL